MARELLSKVELIELWTSIANSFGSTLEQPVNNWSSLVLKFEFEHGVGKTEVKLSDLASHGNTMNEDLSTFKTSITTRLNVVSSNKFKLTLLPLFPTLLSKVLKGAYIIPGQLTNYWLRTTNQQFSDRLRASQIIEQIERFNSFYAKLYESELITSTSTFLGKSEELQSLLDIHNDFLKLTSN